MGSFTFNPDSDNVLMNYCCEVWYRRYSFGEPTEWVGAFKTLEDAQKFINITGDPEHHVIKTINQVYTHKDFLGQGVLYLRVAKIKLFDIENGFGVGNSIFVQGCPHHCKGCFNENTWDFFGGEEWTKEDEDKLIENCSPWYIKRLSVLGGEPVCQQNVDGVTDLVVRFVKEYPEKDVWLYTGGSIEDVPDRLLNHCDYIVDGPFIEEQRDLMLEFRGSANQKVWQNLKEIDANQTRCKYILCPDIKHQYGFSSSLHGLYNRVL